MVVWVASWLLLVGCKSPCDKLCDNLSAYAQECGFTVPEADVDACVTALESEDAGVCRDFGTAESIRTQWTCDDLEVYFSGAASE